MQTNLVKFCCNYLFLFLLGVLSFFLSFFLSPDLFLPTHCRCRVLLLHSVTLNDTHTR